MFLKLTSEKIATVVGVGLSALILFAAVFPNSNGPADQPPPRPYFAPSATFIGRGNFFNLDEVAAADSEPATLTTPEQLWTVAGTNTVSLNWTRLPQADNYQVEYRDSSSNANKTVDVDVPFFTLRNTRAGTTYYFRVRAKQGEQLSSFTATTAVTPSSLHQTTTTEKTTFEAAAWLPPGFEDPDVRASFERGCGVLTEVNPFWYNFSASGALEPKGGARAPEVVARGHQCSMRVIPTITNNFDGDRVTAFLGDPGKQKQFIESVVTEITSYGYDGIDLDFENVHAGDRDKFTVFLKDISGAVHAAGKLIELTGQAKKSDGDNWDGPGALDLDALRDDFDRFKVMTYDYSRSNSDPGPLAPLPWMQEVLRYWRSKVPAEKLLTGIPFYGYDWSLTTDDDVGIVWDGVQMIKSKYEFKDGFDLASAEPYITYDDEHGPRIVYYQDAASVKRKVETAKEAGSAGIAIWLLGSEDPADLAVIRPFTSETTRIVEKPLNIGLKIKGPEISVSLTRFPEIASVKIVYGPSQDRRTEVVESKSIGLIKLPNLQPGETRYLEAIAYDGAGREIRRSGLAIVEAPATFDDSSDKP